ncbi:Transposon TX1 uncharacterized 149 kDa protein [Vitis vinifera]|uniref:Transposon TX1 uncharacterized 149 kDa protein n=1 Tax=Vitis vinifera TaxID=29760 RepID=A0A438DZ49_VITVI|nr:Transposon TX1 uncharacterized 149 kDa protein [Vitis vinifera]
MRRFSEVIRELGLRDSPLTGGPFTWIRGLNSQATSSPIVLEAGGFSSGKSPFRFENMWLKIDEFKDLVRSWWNGYSVEGYNSHCIAEKFKALKKDLKIWNKEVVGNVSSNRAEDIVKPEILGLFKEFYLHGTFQRSLNSTFLLLIPKKEGAEDLRDFRPISLVGSVYKLLAKVLANRLKSVMGEVIFDSQQAFVQRRQILDVVLIANETLNSRLKDNKSGLLLKMDIENAFDHVNWDFLMEVMSKMGFGHRWINWMK